jgi:hypothetical protein
MKYNFTPLQLKEGTAGTIIVVCKATGRRLPWNRAVLAGWVADSNGEAFRAYYSPEGVDQVKNAAWLEGTPKGYNE